MNKKVLHEVDELTSLIFEGLKKEMTAWGEPQTFVDVISYDDENETIICVRVTEEREDLEPKDYFYKAEIIVTTNDDVLDDDNVLTSEGVGVDVIRELCESILKTDFSSYISA